MGQALHPPTIIVNSVELPQVISVFPELEGENRIQYTRCGLRSPEQRGQCLPALLLVHPYLPIFQLHRAPTAEPLSPQSVLLPVVLSAQGQGFQFFLMEFQEVALGPFLQAAQVPLASLPLSTLHPRLYIVSSKLSSTFPSSLFSLFPSSLFLDPICF